MASEKPQSGNELQEIANSLRQLVNLEAYKIIQAGELKSNVEKILFLDKLGFAADEIAQILGTTAGTVRKELSINKSKRRTS